MSDVAAAAILASVCAHRLSIVIGKGPQSVGGLVKVQLTLSRRGFTASAMPVIFSCATLTRAEPAVKCKQIR